MSGRAKHASLQDSGATSLSELPLFVAEGADATEAEELSRAIGAPLLDEPYDPSVHTLAVLFDSKGMALSDGRMELRLDFAAKLPRLKPGRVRQELLVRAAKVATGRTRPRAVDATAGLGEDALLLTAAGFSVTLYERNPVIAALLRDALARAARTAGLADIVARMSLVEGDSTTALAKSAETPDLVPDLVYLDPMFPTRQKSAAVKKKFQLLHRLERPCSEHEQEELLRAAFAAQPRKVVVKRPPKAPSLAGTAPSYTIAGKAVRFDCYVLPYGKR